MSLILIRKAFEKKLATAVPNLSTAYENVAFTPVAGTPYQQVNLLPAQPDNSTLGGAFYREVGLFQVLLYYPNANGPLAAQMQAEVIKQLFKRGTSMVEGGITVNVIRTPAIAPAIQDVDRYVIPISIYYQCDIFN